MFSVSLRWSLPVFNPQNDHNPWGWEPWISSKHTKSVSTIQIISKQSWINKVLWLFFFFASYRTPLLLFKESTSKQGYQCSKTTNKPRHQARHDLGCVWAGIFLCPYEFLPCWVACISCSVLVHSLSRYLLLYRLIGTNYDTFTYIVYFDDFPHIHFSQPTSGLLALPK